METKLTKDIYEALRAILTNEWDCTNLEKSNFASYDSIQIGWQRATWTISTLRSHKQLLHSQLYNVRGYMFDFTTMYGENDASTHCELWSNKIGSSINIRVTRLIDGRGLQ